ncbi:hypothetical protein PYR66_05190 [Klebsiella aerogenes]|nr:hypothetical protein PYR66_05190 [Klebsiella aerogenes]
MALRLSGLLISCAGLPGWRCVYPGYRFGAPVFPDGAALIRATDFVRRFPRMALRLSGLLISCAGLPGWHCAYPGY